MAAKQVEPYAVDTHVAHAKAKQSVLRSAQLLLLLLLHSNISSTHLLRVAAPRRCRHISAFGSLMLQQHADAQQQQREVHMHNSALPGSIQLRLGYQVACAATAVLSKTAAASC